MTGEAHAGGSPMRRDPGGARWCEDHGRWECVKNAKRGGLCHGTRIVGLDRCRMHAGQSAELAAHRGRAALAAVTYGLPREVDPGQALLEEVHRTAGHVAWLASVVADLERDEMVWGVVEETDKPVTDSGGGTEVKRRAVPNPWLVLYQQERDRLMRASKAAIDAGVSERVVAVYEQIAGSYVTVLERVLDALNLDQVQRARAAEVAQRELRALAGGAA